MIYTELTKKAMQIAYRAHEGQLDKSDVPYIFHPCHLAEQMKTEHGVIVALLHDVVEDSDITLEDLAAEGFPPDVLEAVRAVSGIYRRAEGEPPGENGENGRPAPQQRCYPPGGY